VAWSHREKEREFRRGEYNAKGQTGKEIDGEKKSGEKGEMRTKDNRPRGQVEVQGKAQYVVVLRAS